MNELLTNCLTGLNSVGTLFCDYAARAFVQSALLIVLLYVIDVLLRKRVRAVFRYGLWMLVLAKLVLPPTLALPTGIGYWVGDRLPAVSPAAERAFDAVGPERTSPLAQTRRAEPLVRPDASDLPIASANAVLPPITWQAGLFILWLVGVLTFLIVLIQRVRFVRTLVAASRPGTEELLDVLERCRRQMAVRRDIRLRISDAVSSPAVCGVLRPAVLMPAVLVEKLSPDAVRATLIHELAHIKRGDLWVNAAQTILQVIYFYNPFVWFANSVIRKVCEEAVDETVLVTLGGEASDYSNTLIDIGETAFWKADLGLRLIGVAESKRALQWRIRHMLTRPIPRSARIGFCGVLAIVAMGAVLLPMACAGTDQPNGATAEYHLLVLDNSDPEFQGKDEYDDRLYLMDSDGNVEAAISGFNLAESFGGSHKLAVDEQRGTLWVTENVGARLWHFDLNAGRLLKQLPDMKARAVAIDPDTGDAWILICEGRIGRGHVEVVSPAGQVRARHNISGWDIAYSRYDKSFWIAGKNVYKVSRSGEILGDISGRIPWTAVSVDVNQRTGEAWIVVRDHAQVVESKPELWVVDKDVRVKQTIDLADLFPYCVAVDSQREMVWVGCLGTTLRFSTSGDKLRSARTISSWSIVPGRPADSMFSANSYGVSQVRVSESGFLHFHAMSEEVMNKPGSRQKWLAMIPFADATLRSSPGLVQLTQRESEETPIQPYPDSAERLKKLGRALLIYANDFDDTLPDSLQKVRDGYNLNGADFKWLQEHVTYVGKGRPATDPPDTVIAYDRTLLGKEPGTVVLYLDSHVMFERSNVLARLGIKPNEE